MRCLVGMEARQENYKQTLHWAKNSMEWLCQIELDVSSAGVEMGAPRILQNQASCDVAFESTQDSQSLRPYLDQGCDLSHRHFHSPLAVVDDNKGNRQDLACSLVQCCELLAVLTLDRIPQRSLDGYGIMDILSTSDSAMLS